MAKFTNIAQTICGINLAIFVKQPVSLRIATVAVNTAIATTRNTEDFSVPQAVTCAGFAVTSLRLINSVKNKQFKREFAVGAVNASILSLGLFLDYKGKKK